MKVDKYILKDIGFTLFAAVLSIVLFFVPTGFEGAKLKGGLPVKTRVTSVDNTFNHKIGIINTGEQTVTMTIVTGKYRGQKISSTNHFMGKLEFDRVYKVGDRVFTVLEVDEQGKILYGNIIDYYRLDYEVLLFVIFIAFLLLYSGWTGFKALISFVFTGVMIWKILLPGVLRGIDPIVITFIVTMTITAVIIFLIGGFTRKGITAFIGSGSGVLITLILSMFFGKLFSISGGVKPFSETLLYSGYQNIDLAKLFLSGIFIASSGALMDISMDVSASMHEVAQKNPDITSIGLIKTGFSVGRAVMGTMTTTLLLAYSASYGTLLMVFIAQGTPVINIFNLQYVAAEILNTLVGSFGLIAVAPLTALAGGLIYKKRA